MRKATFVIAFCCISVFAVMAQSESDDADKNPPKQLTKATPENETSAVFLKKEIYKRDDFSRYATKILPPQKEKESEDPNKIAEDKYEVQVNFSSESLTGGYGVWRTAGLHFRRNLEEKRTVWGEYRLSQRNKFRDQEFVGGFYAPVNKRWAVTAEGMYSPSAKYVGVYSVMGEIERIFSKGWVGHLGGRFTHYTTVDAATGYALVEKYWGANRLANTLYVTRLSNAGVAPSYRIQYNRYYGERINSLGTAFSIGREHENIGPPTGIIRSNTWSISGSFRHWVNNRVGISADVLLHRQGDLYYRRGINFGARYRF